MPGPKLAVQNAVFTGRIALILAPDERGLFPVFGIPAARRLALLVRQLGFSDIHMIGRTHPYRRVLSDLIPPNHFHSLEKTGNIIRVLEEIYVPDRAEVLVLMAAHVVDKPTLSRIIDNKDYSETVFLKNEENQERIYLTSSSRKFSVINELWNPHLKSGALRAAKRVRVQGGLPCALDGGEQSRIEAEKALMQSMALQTSKSDGFFARHISRKISRWMSRRLVLSPVTPNQITLLGAMIGLAGALYFSLGGYWPQLAGAALFLCCVIVDGVDGEIARLKLLESDFGHKFDIIMDNVVHVAIFTGIGTGIYRDTGDIRYLFLLMLMLVGFALCGLAVYHFLSQKSPDGAPGLQSAGIQGIIDLLNNRDFAYLLVLFSATGTLHVFLAGATGGVFAFALTLWIFGSKQFQILSQAVKEGVLRLRAMVFGR